MIGLGETFFGPASAEAYIHEYAAPRLILEARHSLQIDRHLAYALLDGYLGFSGSGAEMRGLSAIDIALWDLFGQVDRTSRSTSSLAASRARKDPDLQHLCRAIAMFGKVSVSSPTTGALMVTPKGLTRIWMPF